MCPDTHICYGHTHTHIYFMSTHIFILTYIHGVYIYKKVMGIHTCTMDIYMHIFHRYTQTHTQTHNHHTSSYSAVSKPLTHGQSCPAVLPCLHPRLYPNQYFVTDDRCDVISPVLEAVTLKDGVRFKQKAVLAPKTQPPPSCQCIPYEHPHFCHLLNRSFSRISIKSVHWQPPAWSPQNLMYILTEHFPHTPVHFNCSEILL